MKQIEVVAAIIYDSEGRIFATQGDMATIRIGGSFLVERWKREKRLKKR